MLLTTILNRNMEIEQYAPVLIPTLNRYEHFKRCLESLERCTGADMTDVYVGLDYPPSDKYRKGWEKIDLYLKEKEKMHCFKNLYVRRRDHNCGVGKPGSNGSLLLEEIKKVSDRYIESEDDNEFSPNFLVYMNKAFEMFKDNERIMCVSGYNHRELQNISSDSVYCSYDAPAYGLGFWCDKKKKYDKWTYENLLTEIKHKPIISLKMAFSYPRILNMAITMIKEKENYGDVRYATYNMFHNTFCLCPTLSLSRNWGCDGSGLHSGFIEGIEKNEISSERDFAISEIEIKLPAKYRYYINNRLYGHKISIRKRILVLLRMLELIMVY